jgi:SAM-dependent methyltransferase
MPVHDENSSNGSTSAGGTARDHFGAKAGRYAELDVFSQEEFYQPLFDAAAPVAGERALDLATGTGLMLLMLSRVVETVVGSDVTPEMLARAEAVAAEAGAKNVSFVEAEASSLPLPDAAFDLVTCRTAFHHFPDPVKALSEIHRVLKPGGRFVMEDVFGPDDPELSETREAIERALDPFHVRAYSVTELEQMFSAAGFKIENDSYPETGHMPLEIIAKLENIKEPEARENLEKLLRNNLDRDLVGFRIDEVDGELLFKWEIVIIAAAKTG